MDSSKFNLWRACFSFCFVDGFLAPEEQAWIEEKIQTLKFSPEQIEILKKDLVDTPRVSEILPLLTSPADRGFLINNMRVLAKIDHFIAPSEKEKIEKIRAEVLSQVDLLSLEKVIAEDEKASYHEDEVYQVYNKHSYIEHLVKELMKKLNPGDYKFPEK